MMFNKQTGNSLLEFLIASSLGVITIGTITSVFIHAQKTAMQRTQELVLLQNTASVVQMMRADIQRAGFDGGQGKSIKLSGALSTVFAVSSATRTLVAYAYLSDVSGGVPVYNNVVYQRISSQPNSFYVCEKELVNRVMDVTDAQDFSNKVGGACYNLFAPNTVHVNQFHIKESKIENSGVSSTFLSVRVGTELALNSNVETMRNFTIKQRNWQE
ncbi:PilW family protein [Vibrio rotiferianus]|uniref:PilW family protein n=1 Tax=Vibrio rotiferianus TaxID=190895 RepID=UPI00148B4FD0|nr:pilus assembly protein PilW [Vibrio rotiferianus]NOH68727.1 pilus assembly protein PilW [Vibrio rotiferianus]